MDRANEVRNWLKSRTDEMAELVEQLVAVDTENPPGRGLDECGRVLRDAMEGLGLLPKIIEVAGTGQMEKPCIVRGAVGHGARTLYFHGHFDVVPAQSREQFYPQRRDGNIIGRGTADMKGGLVSMVYGAAAAEQGSAR